MIPKQKNTTGHFLKKFSLIFLVILAAIAGGFFWWKASLLPVTPLVSGQPGANKIFIVKKGESLSSVAQRLEEEKLIRSALAFKILVLTQGLANKIQAGDFRLSPLMDAEQIVRNLIHGKLDVWLTFPEGWRKEEFGERLSANLENFDYTEFILLTKNLEGYLFPDTYLIPKDATPSAVVRILTNNFEKKTKNWSIGKQELILASIVEREGHDDQDRPLVAGILRKRWQKNWLLQADATIQYVAASAKCQASSTKCDWWRPVEKEDLEIDSPYNTYKYKGLPPAPICNPGLASIKAVLQPQESDYWFYLSDPTGQTHYARTIEEHQQNIARYLR